MDNGAMENFFGRLKVEMFYGEKFESVNTFIDELRKYIHYTRVTPQEKSKIEQLAVKCGLSQSEYLRKRALGFVPKEVPPGAFFDFYGKLDDRLVESIKERGVIKCFGYRRAKDLSLYPGRVSA